MSTATDIIVDAYAMLGVYSPGETVTAADMAQAFTCLNDLLDNWDTQSLAAYAYVDQSVTLVTGKSSYTVGPGGDLNGVRPLKVNSNPGSAYVIDTQQNYYPISVIDQFSWNQISSRNVSGTWPDVMFYDPQYPLGVLNVWPSPQGIGYTLHFTSRLTFVDAVSQTSTVSLPPGYILALKCNLAQMLIPYFAEQSQASAPFVIKQATKTLADVKRVNSITPLANFDVGISKAQTPYNIYTDR